MSVNSTTLDCGMFTLEDVSSCRPYQYPPHEHERAHMVVLLEGALVEGSDDDPRILPADELHFRPRGFSHDVRIACAPFHALVVEFKVEASSLLCSLLRVTSSEFRLPNTILGDLPHRLCQEMPRRDAPSPYVIEALLVETVAAAARAFPPQETEAVEPWLDRALTFIESRLSAHLSVDEVAAAAGVAPSTLNASFQRQKGLAVGAYIRQRRLACAASQLLQSSRSINDIALAHGFADQAHFSRRFREAFAMTPREYRRNFRGQL
jgi:AraC-like DNA-binding protein